MKNDGIDNNIQREPQGGGCRDFLTVWFMQAFSAWNSIKPFEISMHKAENKKAWEEYLAHHKGRYVEDQEKLPAFKYGHKSFDWITKRTVGENSICRDGGISGRANTCQIIALYNSLTGLGDGKSRVSPAGLIELFENRGAVLNACMGSSPKAAVRVLKDLGYKVRFCYAHRMSREDYKRLSEEYESFIMVAFNDRDSVMKGLHVMSITKGGDGSFERHNDGSGSASVFPSLCAAAMNYNGGRGRPLCLMGIRG